jgi:hypothetical protein
MIGVTAQAAIGAPPRYDGGLIRIQPGKRSRLAQPIKDRWLRRVDRPDLLEIQC